MSLASSEGSSQRFYSISAQIREEHGDYYGILERTQKGAADITAWMDWFLGCLTRATGGAQAAYSGIITKARQARLHQRSGRAAAALPPPSG
jgi:Fic family protein